MTKRMLVKWLESTQYEKLSLLKQKYQEAKNQHDKRLEERLLLAEYSHEIFQLLSKADDIAAKFYENAEKINGVNLKKGMYGTFTYHLASLLSLSRVRDSLLKAIEDGTDENEDIGEQYEKATANVKATYQRVILNVKNMNDAKMGMKYLEELGFDLSKLTEQENNPSTALSVPINTQYLMLGEGE